jgi:hypothetical protein
VCGMEWTGPPAGEQTAWADACPMLDATAAQLAPAQLLHAPAFSYFEAMSAVQLMDAQMDAGLSRGGASNDDSVAELVGKGRAPLALSPQQLLAVLGRLTACEVRGGARFQTLSSIWNIGHTGRALNPPSLAVAVELMRCVLTHLTLPVARI